MSEGLLPCPFCGGTAHVRSKVRYRRNEEHPEGAVFDFRPGMPEYGIPEGEVEQTVDVYDWSFGFQAWCGRCKAKLPYAWGPWHSYTEDELETLDRSDFCGHKPGPEDETAREQAARAWNRRAERTCRAVEELEPDGVGAPPRYTTHCSRCGQLWEETGGVPRCPACCPTCGARVVGCDG